MTLLSHQPFFMARASVTFPVWVTSVSDDQSITGGVSNMILEIKYGGVFEFFEFSVSGHLTV